MMNILKRKSLNENMHKNEYSSMSKADIVWLDSITKRQKLIINDLIEFSRSYPDSIDREMVGSFICLYELLADTNESMKYSAMKENRFSSFIR